VKRSPVLENLTGAIVEISRSGLHPDALRDHVLVRLRRAVPFDAAFWSTVDPGTLLFTQPHQDSPRRRCPTSSRTSSWTMTLPRATAGQPIAPSGFFAAALPEER
jgi:hypothetical protein